MVIAVPQTDPKPLRPSPLESRPQTFKDAALVLRQRGLLVTSAQLQRLVRQGVLSLPGRPPRARRHAWSEQDLRRAEQQLAQRGYAVEHAVDDWGLEYCSRQVVRQLLLAAHHHNSTSELELARFYLDREIQHRQEGR